MVVRAIQKPSPDGVGVRQGRLIHILAAAQRDAVCECERCCKREHIVPSGRPQKRIRCRRAEVMSPLLEIAVVLLLEVVVHLGDATTVEDLSVHGLCVRDDIFDVNLDGTVQAGRHRMSVT